MLGGLGVGPITVFVPNPGAALAMAVRRPERWELVGQGRLARGGYALPYQEHQHGHH